VRATQRAVGRLYSTASSAWYLCETCAPWIDVFGPLQEISQILQYRFSLGMRFFLIFFSALAALSARHLACFLRRSFTVRFGAGVGWANGLRGMRNGGASMANGRREMSTTSILSSGSSWGTRERLAENLRCGRNPLISCSELLPDCRLGAERRILAEISSTVTRPQIN